MTHAAPKWGTVTTTNAPAARVLEFCAYHLDLGAHRVYINLDRDDPTLFDILKAHPKIRPIKRDPEHWTGGTYPQSHRLRQTRNFRRCYNRRAACDWLFHIDVDEFLWPQSTIHAALLAIPEHINALHVQRTYENLAEANDRQEPEYFRKSCPPHLNSMSIYGAWGAALATGFWGHNQGKAAVRTGHVIDTLVPHEAVVDGQKARRHPIQDIALCHMHARTADDFLAHMEFRFHQGSYRKPLKDEYRMHAGTVNMHAYLELLYDEGGSEAWRIAFEGVSLNTPDKRERLARYGLLHHCPLGLKEKSEHYFGHAASL